MKPGDAAPPVTVSPEAFLQMGRQVLAQQPFSALIGAELMALSPGQCVLQLPITGQLKQQHGFVLDAGEERLCALAQGTIAALPAKDSP